ncbi:hypothetical protein CB1_002303001 [Camelus ferus]|nr:hypothetical protein CB1_002303001 [Camelus ferus]
MRRTALRFGRILEDLDSLGVLICYMHTKIHSAKMSPLSIVTALVDKIDMCKKSLSPEQDIKFSGHVCWVGKTSMEVKIQMFQERNIFNRIFGGFLMRKAYELGWATACNFGRLLLWFSMLSFPDSGSRPFVVAVDDIMFQKPVEVGSLLFLSSQVCFTQENYIQVRVHSEVASLQDKEHMTTNVFHFTFMSEKEVPLVFPRTYGESMLYLDGQRHFNSMSVPVTLNKEYLVEP